MHAYVCIYAFQYAWILCMYTSDMCILIHTVARNYSHKTYQIILTFAMFFNFMSSNKIIISSTLEIFHIFEMIQQ